MTHSRIQMALVVAGLAALVFACGGGGNTAPGEAVTLDSLCQASCSQVERCPEMWPDRTSESCESECRQRTGAGYFSVYRPEVVVALRDCFEDLSCGENDDSCLEDAVLAVYSTGEEAEQDPLFVTCRAKVEECETDEGRPFLDDLCADALFIIDEVEPRFEACVKAGAASPCGGVQACLCEALSLPPMSCYYSM